MIFFDKTIKGLVHDTDTAALNIKGLGIPLGKRFLDLRIGNYGVADIIVAARIEGGLGIVILLFDDSQIGIKEFFKAVEIRRGIERFFEKRGIQGKYIVKTKIKLIGRDLESSAGFWFMPGMFPSIEYLLYSLDIDGFSFKYLNQSSLADEGF